MEQMLFGSIVIDSALRERLGYQIPIDKNDVGLPREIKEAFFVFRKGGLGFTCLAPK
jgi:hypothetical protein